MLGPRNVILFISLTFNILLAFILLFALTPEKKAVESNQKEYPLLSKRIFVEDPNDTIINFIPLRQKLREYISKNGDRMDMYFEYLPSGASIGINDKAEVRIASLVKVPTIMEAYRQIEEGELSRNDLLTITEANSDNQFGELWKRGIGSKVTLAEALKITLTDSDNTAYLMVREVLKGGKANRVFDYLDIPIVMETGFPIISPKNYSSMLRALYLSSYVSKESSSEILENLTQTKYNDKLPAGVPKDIKVAHKIGVYDSDPKQSKVYSDCGIVYIPKRPYILCMMTNNMEEEGARKQMEEISKMAFDYVISYNK